MLYCPSYYTEAQLEQLYGCQAENMADVPLRTRQLTQAEYVRLVTRHSQVYMSITDGTTCVFCRTLTTERAIRVVKRNHCAKGKLGRIDCTGSPIG